MTAARSRRFGLRLAAMALAVLSVIGEPAAAAPAHLVVTTPAGANVNLGPWLARHRASGAVTAVQLLDVARGVRSAETVPPNVALGSLAILEFADDAALARWEKTRDAKFPAGATVTRVDRLSQLEVTPRDSTSAVYLLAEYEIMVPPPRYKEYVDGYVMPQMRAWRDAGLITRATMFAARDRTTAPFHAVLVLEHRDAAAFAKREAIKDGSRKELAADPAWKALSDVKATIRTEKFLSRATAVAVPAPRG